MQRLAVSLFGAIVFSLLYRIALTSSGLEMANDIPHKLLLMASGLAAAMVGGTLAILIYDRMKR